MEANIGDEKRTVDSVKFECCDEITISCEGKGNGEGRGVWG